MKNYFLTLLLTFLFAGQALSQAFVHPGLLHTQTDLTRMKDRVAQGAHPWIDGWNKLIQDPKAQSNYTGRARANMNLRQVMSDDAIAAYLNALRWYISGDNSYAQCAIGILNNYSTTVNQIPSGGNTDIDGLGGIGVAMMCNAAEIMKLYSGWSSGDVNRFKNMMVDYFYPLRHEFLTNHRGSCISNYWANWDANNIAALLAIGVVADNRAIYDEGVDYFYNGAGNGSINNAVPYVHAGGLGQFQESGRDQDHAQLAVGLLADVCQIAWNQGQDLFAASSNRLLAGAEYTARYNMMQNVPFTTYNNCQPANHDWPAINARGKIHERPIWELLYNHYVVRQGLNAPFVEGMAKLVRPEGGSKDHLGYGTLTYTLNPSTYPPNPVPGVPLGVVATAGTGQVILTWQPPNDLTANGYVIQRSTSSGGGFSTIETYNLYINTRYVDNNVSNGATYYYRIAAVNQAGTGTYSAVSNSATPLAASSLPSGWSKAEIGSHNAGNATYANVSGGTYVINGYGTGVGGTADNVTYVYRQITGDGTITGRINSMAGTVLKTGLMIRENLNADAKTVAMTLGEGGWRFARMGYRVSAGANMGSTLGNTYTWQPAWFRITRSGNTFTAFESSNGVTWFQVGSVNISMANSYYVGLVVTSGNATAQNTTAFDNVTVGGVVCNPTSIIPILQVNGGSWQTTTAVTINPGDQIKFGPQPVTGGSWSWSGSGTSGTSREQTISPTTSGTATVIHTNSCGAQSTAAFTITVNGSGGPTYYQIRNRSTGLVLDGMGRTTNGDACGQYANTTTHVNSHWEMISTGNYYYFQNRGTGLRLDGMGRTSNDSDLGQWANTTSNNAQWAVQQYSGSYYRIQNRATGLFMDGMGRTANGSNAGQWTNTTSTNAQWELVPVSGSSTSSSTGIMSSKILKEKEIKWDKYTISEAQLYPNPVSSVLTLEVPEKFATGEVKILDSGGNLALESKLSIEKSQVDVNQLAPGTYIIHVTGKDTKTWSRKFIIK